MNLIRTTMGTARLMDEDELLQDLNLAIVRTYPLLTESQSNDLRIGYSTQITDGQLKQIKELAGV